MPRSIARAAADASASALFNWNSRPPAAAENLIKQHKAQLASDRTSCRSPLANQFRLILHTAAYWLLSDVRDQVPCPHPLRQSEFGSIRLHLLKIAGRVRVALASCCPHAEVFRHIALRLQPAGP